MKIKIISAFTSRWVLMLVCALHSVFLLVLSYVWINQPISYADEALLTKGTIIAKRMLLGEDDRPPKNRFVFVNVSWDKKLIPKMGTIGDTIGHFAITDRARLAEFLQAIKVADAHKYIICDINFDFKSPQDGLLAPALESTPRLITSYHRDKETNKAYPPVFQVESGLADYESDFGTFFKFTLLYDTLKTVPVKAYEALYPDREVVLGTFFTYVDGSPALNTFILDYRIRPYYLRQTDSLGYEYYNMGEILNMPAPVRAPYLMDALKDKIVVIGDFEDRDIHGPIMGDMPGSLILLNALLALETGDMLISWGLVAFLFIVYFFLSLDVFTLHELGFRTRWKTRLLQGASGKLVSDFFGYFFLLSITSIISYFFFNQHLNVLLFAVYLSGLEFGVRFFSKRMKRTKN